MVPFGRFFPVRGRNRAKRYFQALLTEFPAVSHRSVKEWANKHPAKAQLAHRRRGILKVAQPRNIFDIPGKRRIHYT
ncbi:conserved hypothetical protein [Ricinus communis]|uniref:Uncharacterized protein n=1 Tax=Ricinus communis TaxID=3988 RepID=B9TB21_RICCO|nr:conserved hypothetical protein [Ricinus communis]